VSNAIKGEVTLLHAGKSYIMVLDFNALAEFEDEVGANALALIQTPDKMSARQVRALFWAGLKQRQPDVTLEDAGRILTSNFDKMGEALGAAFPDAEPEKPAGKPVRARARR